MSNQTDQTQGADPVTYRQTKAQARVIGPTSCACEGCHRGAVYGPVKVKPTADHRDWQSEMERIGQQLAQLQAKYARCNCQGITTRDEGPQ